MVRGEMAIASFKFLERGGSVTRWLTIMTSMGEELDMLGKIYCGAPRRQGEGDESLRKRCMENWRPDSVGDESDVSTPTVQDDRT